MVNANTDTDFDEDDALEAVYTIHDQVGEAKRAYEDGPSPAQLAEKVSKVEQEAQEIARFADSISDLCGDINGSYDGLHALVDSGEEVWDALEIIQDRIGVIEAALDADDGDTVNGTLTLDGREFEVEMTPVGGMPVAAEEAEGFGKWLKRMLREIDGLDKEYLAEKSLVSKHRLQSIINGESPQGDEAPSILKTMVNGDFITEDTRSNAETVLLDGDTDDEPEGLAELFD
jgi:hypothetical protein